LDIFAKTEITSPSVFWFEFFYIKVFKVYDLLA
jgi:hypothetical protein